MKNKLRVLKVWKEINQRKKIYKKLMQYNKYVSEINEINIRKISVTEWECIVEAKTKYVLL